MCLCKEHSLVCKHVNYTQLVKEIRTSSVTSSMCGAEQSEAQTASKWSRVELWNPRISMSRLRCEPSVVLKTFLYRFALSSGRSFILHPSISKVFLSHILSFLLCRWFIPFLLCFPFCVISSFKIFFYESSAIRGLHRYHASPLLFTTSRSDTLPAAGTPDWHHITAEPWVSLLSQVCLPSILCIYTKVQTGDFSLNTRCKVPISYWNVSL